MPWIFSPYGGTAAPSYSWTTTGGWLELALSMYYVVWLEAENTVVLHASRSRLAFLTQLLLMATAGALIVRVAPEWITK